MKHQPYLPDDDDGVLDLLVALDTNLPGALATKYGVSANQLFRLARGRLAFDWFLEALTAGRDWSKSLTAERNMMDGLPGTPQALPVLPVLPAVPMMEPEGGGTEIPVQMEPGFFDFLGRLVQQIKDSEVYDPAEGMLLKIVGAEIPPPDESIVPEPSYKFGTGGVLILMVKKTPFQGYAVKVARGSAASVDAGFSSSREYPVPLPLPPAGTAEVWTVQVQYRYKNAPFGQWSQPLVITVRGV